MDKDQCHVQTLRTLYLYRILSPQDLFIAKKSTLKQTITSSGSWDISNLVSGNLVVTNWSADNSVNTDCLQTFLVLFEGLLKGFW